MKKIIIILFCFIFIGFFFNCIPEYDEDISRISVYFTEPYSDPILDDVLIEKINEQSTNHTLDLCFYGFDRDNVITAIENAIYRGVHVRFVANKDGSDTVDSENGDYYTGYKRVAQALDTMYPVDGKARIDFPNDTGFDDFILINNSIMHNKFALITNENDKKYLYAGTTNCTETGFTRNNNNSLLIQDEGIVETYRQQFEYLLELPGSQAVDSVCRHTIDGIDIDVLFAPQLIDGKSTMEHLINLVNEVDVSINFMIFCFPHRGLNELMLEKFQNNIDVKGIFDESQLNNSAEEYFAQRGVPVKIDGNYWQTGFHGGKLHHKTMILDYSQEDAVVVTGSFNWSNNANENNDENILFIHSKKIAQLYQTEWQKRWDEGTDVPTITPGDDANYQDILINEVMWMGSRKEYSNATYQDEFIELKNFTSNTIDLSGWAIEGAATSGKPILLPEGTYINPNSIFVLLTYYPSDSAFQPPQYKIHNQLAVTNTDIMLILKDQDGTIIDYACDGSDGEDFAGYNGSGSGSPKKSMARNDIYDDGRIKDNWFTTITQENISSEYEYLSYNFATPGAENDAGALSFDPLDIVISEIGWAGTDTSTSDEWIELYNNTTSDINLSGWTLVAEDGTPDIMLSGIIPAGKHFLLERTDDSSVPTKAADLIYTGALSNTVEHLELKYDTSLIDETPSGASWAAGNNSPIISMERINFTTDGSNSGNWQDGTGDIEGAENSSDS